MPASSNIAQGSAAKPSKENPLSGARNDRLSWPTTLNACSGPWGAPSYCTSLQPLRTANSYPCHEPTEIPSSQTTAGEGIVQALRQVVNTPKIEYLHFNGDPLKYTTFVHNFVNCVEKDNPDEARKLQLLIQHCTGGAKEAIESCVNLPSGDGSRVAKETLHQNFGKSHVIVEADITKLMDLPNLKSGDGPSLLEFARPLNTAERTLTGTWTSCASDLDHMNTLRGLVKKLPMYLRARWTERAGNIIESGCRPKFEDFLKFIKERANLVNNEFGRDMNVST